MTAVKPRRIGYSKLTKTLRWHVRFKLVKQPQEGNESTFALSKQGDTSGHKCSDRGDTAYGLYDGMCRSSPFKMCNKII